MRKTFWFQKDQDELLAAVTKALTDAGEIKQRKDADQPSESAAIRWLIEQEAKRRGVKQPA